MITRHFLYIDIDSESGDIWLSDQMDTIPDYTVLKALKIAATHFEAKGEDWVNSARQRHIEEMSEQWAAMELPKKSKANLTGYVYVIKCNRTNLYKIGRAKNMKTRLAQIKTANADTEVVLSHFVENPHQIEQGIHRTFLDKKVKGEWFDISSQDIESIDSFLKTLSSHE